jgi:NAD(P)-dependent dehydrogenase (short-subunit alcohol dehydrogenase family)
MKPKASRPGDRRSRHRPRDCAGVHGRGRAVHQLPPRRRSAEKVGGDPGRRRRWRHAADVGDAAGRGAGEENIETFGDLQILVNNATIRGHIMTMENAWDEVLRTNLKSTFSCSKAVRP